MFLGFRVSSIVVGWVVAVLLLVVPGPASGLRCFVCGGHSGTPCRGGIGHSGEAMEHDTQVPGEAGAEGQDPVQECTDLINNRGCVKQFVNGVVLLRGCWLDGSNKCLKNGAAEVCTCSHDLCNTGVSRHRTLAPSVISLLSLLTSLLVTRHLATS